MAVRTHADPVRKHVLAARRARLHKQHDRLSGVIGLRRNLGQDVSDLLVRVGEVLDDLGDVLEELDSLDKSE